MRGRKIRRIFIPNRGEVAVRIIRACFDEGIESVVGFSEADRTSSPVWIANAAVCIGPADATNSYLNLNAVIAGALNTRSDAVHPGYGFLAESATLSRLCEEHNLAFIGPKPATLELWNDKVAARTLAAGLGIPVAEGTGLLSSLAEASNQADAVGYPLMLKSSAGGGGRGMRSIHSAAELQSVFQTAAQEALLSCGDDRLYLERLVESARHIEVQILSDAHGNIVHLGTRDCTAQRRYQKVVEEAPAELLPAAVEAEIIDAAISLAKAGGHVGAGTVEFLFDTARESFIFLEVNGRLQVEHGVTEQVTSLDIVREQIHVASGRPLAFSQSEVTLEGHSVELRVTCEDASVGFVPSPGCITVWGMPVGRNVRVDTHCYPGYVVPRFYDPLLAKLIFTGPNRKETIATAKRALSQMTIRGIPTNACFLERLISHPVFEAQRHDTSWLESRLLPEYVGWARGRSV